MQDKIGYDDIIESSMRNIVYEVLKKVEKDGLKGAHHFIITFATGAAGVNIPESLKEKFPHEMTIVIQHQFNSLSVKEDLFNISLSFSGKQENLTIPYNAISSFADPSVNFGLKFNAIDVEEADLEELEEFFNEESNDDSATIDTSSKIISLEEFRKNRNKKK